MYTPYKIVLLLSFAVLHITGSNEVGIGNNETDATFTTPEPKTDTEGGFETNVEGSSGTISYKPYTQTSQNERCVWTVRNRQATRYRITLTNLGLPSSVIISTVSTSGSLSHFVPTVASTTARTSTGSLLLITFFSGNSTGKGFSLTYDTAALNGVQGSTSREVVAASNIGPIKHPSSGSTYANRDVSVFVFAPECVNDVRKSTQVIYIKDALEGTSCWDTLSLYRFDVTLGSTNKWRSIGQLCGGVNSEVITSTDLILIVFKSDSSNVGTGFHLFSSSV